MGRIILVTGGNQMAVENYSAKRLTCADPSPASPFWLDLLSPSKSLLCLISKRFKLDPRVQSACLSRHRVPNCEDFGDYLFIQTSLLEPSKRHIFIQRDIKVVLNREHLITVHKSRTPLAGLVSSSENAGVARTGSLLLTVVDRSIERVEELFCSEEQMHLLVPNKHQPQNSPLWWRLSNFKAALLRDANLYHKVAIAGDRFFDPEDKSLFDSIGTRNDILSNVTTRLLSRMFPHVEMPYVQTRETIP